MTATALNPSDYGEARAWCSAPGCSRGTATGTIRTLGEPEVARLGCERHRFELADRWLCPRGHWHRAPETEGHACPGPLLAGGWDPRFSEAERLEWGRW